MNFPRYSATTDFEHFAHTLESDEDHARHLEAVGMQLDIAYALFHARTAAGISRNRLAKKLNIEAKHLQAIEEGNVDTDLALLAKSARILGKKLHIRLK